MSIRTHKTFVPRALAALLFTSMPVAAIALPTCAELATNATYGLAGNPQISALTAALQPTAGTNKAYCQVNFTFSGESGPSGGYLPGQSQQIKIRVGLPPNGVDSANPTAAGGAVWSGKNRDLGGGGYAGSVGGVTSSTNLGYVGTSTDTGHDASEGGTFAINPDNSLNWGKIEDFALDGIHQQHVWGVQLAQTYYGTAPTRKYWMGCSTGGRQGHMQAQQYPKDLDGILAGANAYNWDRFITAEMWPPIVQNQRFGAEIPAAKRTAVANAAIAACDGLDGIVDGLIQEPRACNYNANAFVCQANGGPSSDPNCLTVPEAAAVNRIWDGSRDADGNLAWYPWERSTPIRGFPAPNSGSAGVGLQHFTLWIHQDPSYDWRTITETSFFTDMLASIEKFNDVIGTDDDLKNFRKAGGKMITYHGLNDGSIMPRGTYHYYNAVAQGNYKETQKYYRFFPYPGNGHCGGGNAPLINGEALFSALVDWVENGVEPDYIVATQPASATNPARTRKVCMYPNVPVYSGIGSTNDQANFHCEERKKDDLVDTLTIGKPYETSTKADFP